MNMADLKQKLDEVGASQTELARFMKVNIHRVNRLANDRRVHVRQYEVDAIQRFFETRENPVYETGEDAAALETGGDEPLQSGFTERLGSPENRPGAEVPLFGGVDTPEGWMLSLSPAQQLGRVMGHPAQATARRAFAVEIVDETMSPRFEMGEIAYVIAGQMPRRGGDCVLEMHDRTARVLQFVERTERQVIFRQLNPPRQVIKQPSDKLKIHAIVGRG